MTARTLLTGGTGFIGSAVLDRLLSDGHAVLAFYRSHRPELRHPNLEWRRYDLLRWSGEELSVTLAGEGLEHCLHTAWYTNHADYLVHEVNRDWVAASLRLADAFAAAGGRRFVALGTCIEYDAAAAGPYIEERTPLRPDTLYGECKLALYRALEARGGDFAWPRIFFVYGPGDRAGRLVPHVLATLARGEPAEPRTGGLRRDYIHVEDLAGQLVRIATGTVRGAVTRSLRDARIGWGSYSADFGHPGDRRRFGAYAAMRGLRYERAALDRPYDVALVTHSSDLPAWVRRKRREGAGLKLVFELIDSYFVQTARLRRVAKGIARFAVGTESRLSPDFLTTLVRTCEAADAVICSTEEQREAIRRYNPNVFLSFDWFGGDLGLPKRSYERGGRLRIVWEGQAVTLENLLAIREPLNALRDRIELAIVTDPVLKRWLGRFGGMETRRLLDGIEAPIEFHPWDRATFSDLITGADLAVIPIDANNAMMRGKPENKLILLWQLGMPVLVSPTPAYERAMAKAGIDMVCRSLGEWADRLRELADAPAGTLEGLGRRAREFSAQAYSQEEFAARFDHAFESIGFAP